MAGGPSSSTDIPKVIPISISGKETTTDQESWTHTHVDTVSTALAHAHTLLDAHALLHYMGGVPAPGQLSLLPQQPIAALIWLHPLKIQYWLLGEALY